MLKCSLNNTVHGGISMAKYIVIEGIDGTGKSVQTEKLREALESRGLRTALLSFPQYESFFGSYVGRYLSGKDGVKASEVDQYSMALWFAMDRFDAFRRFDDSPYDAVLINRYVLSNAVYQSIRDIDAGRGDALDFCLKLEHETLGIPVPDLQLILDVSTGDASKNVEKKGFRGYVGDKKDVYEEQPSLQERAREKYLAFARRLPGCEVVPCMENGALLPIETIHERVLERALRLFQ